MNSVEQVRVCLEEIGQVLIGFEERVINEFKMTENFTSEIQTRVIGLNHEFGEKIQASDDKIVYYLMDDKAVGMAVVRRTSFNNAEITMLTTEPRKTDETFR